MSVDEDDHMMCRNADLTNDKSQKPQTHKSEKQYRHNAHGDWQRQKCEHRANPRIQIEKTTSKDVETENTDDDDDETF